MKNTPHQFSGAHYCAVYLTGSLLTPMPHFQGPSKVLSVQHCAALCFDNWPMSVVVSCVPHPSFLKIKKKIVPCLCISALLRVTSMESKIRECKKCIYIR